MPRRKPDQNPGPAPRAYIPRYSYEEDTPNWRPRLDRDLNYLRFRYRQHVFDRRVSVIAALLILIVPFAVTFRADPWTNPPAGTPGHRPPDTIPTGPPTTFKPEDVPVAREIPANVDLRLGPDNPTGTITIPVPSLEPNALTTKTVDIGITGDIPELTVNVTASDPITRFLYLESYVCATRWEESTREETAGQVFCRKNRKTPIVGFQPVFGWNPDQSAQGIGKTAGTLNHAMFRVAVANDLPPDAASRSGEVTITFTVTDPAATPAD